MRGKVIAVNISKNKGEPKKNIKRGFLKEAHGLLGDAHADGGDRQISIFPLEAIMLVPKDKFFGFQDGEYAENITIMGMLPDLLCKGVKLQVGKAIVEIVHIGKDICEEEGRSYIMSREGRFGRVIRGGAVEVGDNVEIIKSYSEVLNLKGMVVTISDSVSQNLREDRSGTSAIERLKNMGISVAKYVVIPDEVEEIQRSILDGIYREGVDIIITTGGTGVYPRDVTPEATRNLLDRELPGFSEILRVVGYKNTPYSIISRGVAGFVGATLIINLPGSPSAVIEAFDLLGDAMVHALKKAKGDKSPCIKT